jgi:DNA-binding protein HU-beta
VAAAKARRNRGASAGCVTFDDSDEAMVATVLEELVALATKEAKATGQFVVPGLGKAVKASRKARMGRNPQTGEAIKIPAKTVVRFRLAKAFKDAIVPPMKK